MEQFMNMLVLALLSMPQAAPVKTMVRIENWPVLKISEHVVAALPADCGTDGTGCAVVNFAERSCDVYIATREPRKAAVRERELKRCQGYDDPPFRLQAAYTQWLVGQPCKLPKEGESRPLIAAAVD
jgi:hypothetical protein